MPDFSRAGSDGALPHGFCEWRRGVTCTVRPELFAPLARGRRYLLNVTLRRQHPRDLEYSDYGALYRRVAAIADARVAEVARRNMPSPLWTWIVAQAWFRNDVATRSFVSASMTRGVMLAESGATAPSGEEAPAPAALRGPSGLGADTFAARHLNEDGERRLDEIYTEFALDDDAQRRSDLTVSYGEYVEAAAVDFAPYVDRAERLAGFYVDSLPATAPPEARTVSIVSREWTSLETSKTACPRMVVVYVYLSDRPAPADATRSRPTDPPPLARDMRATP